MSIDSSREDLSDLSIGATDRGTPRTHTPRAISPVPEREFRRDTLQELPEDQEYNIKLEEPNDWETKGVEGQDGGKNLGGNTPEFHDVQHPQPEAQAREEGKWHNFRSSSSEPEDREGPTEDRSFGSKGLFTNYVSQKWGGSRPPLPPLSAIVSISPTPPSPFVSPVSICRTPLPFAASFLSVYSRTLSS